MGRFSRRSFVALNGLGIVSLIGCSSKSEDSISSEKNANGNSPNTVKTSSNDDPPFEVVSAVWKKSYTGYVVSLSVRNKLSDKALYLCPLSIISYDKSGKQLVDKDGAIIESEAITYYISPGETVYGSWHYVLEGKAEPERVTKIDIVPDYETELPYYYELEPFAGKMFEVSQNGEIKRENNMMVLDLKAEPSDSFKEYAEKYGFYGVQIGAVFFNDKNELVAVADQRVNTSDLSKPILGKAKVIHEYVDSYTKIEYVAYPVFKLDNMKQIPFGKSVYA